MAVELAYLDPGAGSLVLQVVLGTIAAGWVFFRHLLQRLRSIGRRAPADPAALPAEAGPRAAEPRVDRSDIDRTGR